MADIRFKSLPSAAGTYSIDCKFIKNRIVTLAGNVTYKLVGLNDGEELTMIVKQDATGSRTMALTFPSGATSVVLGADTAINATAAKATMVSIVRAVNVYYIVYTLQA